MDKVFETSRLPLTLLLAFTLALSAACSKDGGGSSGPAASAARAYFEAITRKDYAAARKYLSAASIKKLEAEAKDLGKPWEAAWREDVEKQGGAGAVPVISNEKITGDTATVDAKGAGQALTLPMVKEGSEWKVALDKAFPNERILDAPVAGSSPPASSPAASPAETPAPAEDKEEEGEGDDGPDGNDEK